MVGGVKALYAVLLALVLGLGCEEKSSKPETKAKSPSTSPTKEANNNQPKTDLKPKPEKENQEPPKTEPKVEVKKPLTKEESARHAKVIEAAIRKAAGKPTGELTKADLEKVMKLNLGGMFCKLFS